MDLSSSLSQHRPASARRLSLLAALPVVLAAGMLMSPPSVQAATDGAHTTKKAAKAKGSKAAKHRASHAKAGHTAAAAAALAPIMVQAADSQQMAAFERVTVSTWASASVSSGRRSASTRVPSIPAMWIWDSRASSG